LGFMLPWNVEVEWLSPNTTKESFLREDTIVLRIAPYHEDESLNMIVAAQHCARSLILDDTNLILKANYSEATECLLVRKMLSIDRPARRRYDQEIIGPLLEDEDFVSAYDSLATLDNALLFLPVFMRELIHIPDAFEFGTPNPQIRDEVVSFIEWLETIARRPPGQEVDLDFMGSTIKASIVIVASTQTLSKAGIKPHVDRVVQMMDRGFNRIYLLARGRNIKEAREVARVFESDPRVIAIDEEVGPNLRLQTSSGVICLSIADFYQQAASAKEEY